MSYKIEQECIGCTACTKRCPTDAISGVRNGMHIIDPELCIDCGACGVVCPLEGIAGEVGGRGKGCPRAQRPHDDLADLRILARCAWRGYNALWRGNQHLAGGMRFEPTREL